MKGTYVLLIKLNKKQSVKIGSLGTREFGKGRYAYVGSAMNSLRKRIARHLRKSGEKKMHWHIDHLLASENASIYEVLFKEADKKEECEIAQKISARGTGINGFGCSDCNCKSHLFKISPKNLDILNGFRLFK